nr:transcriptional regulator ATRX homolog [Megalopta genalis]
MRHRPECRKYLQWKREQDRKSKKEEKKKTKKDKKPKEKKLLDCLDEDEDDNQPQAAKAGNRKCKKKRARRKRPKNKVQYVLKEISMAELLMKRIKPTMETREILLNPRHIGCLWPTVPDSVSKMVESAMMLLAQKPPKRRERGKKDATKTKKEEEEEDEEVMANHRADGKSRDTIGTKRSESSKAGATRRKSKIRGQRVDVEDSEEEECRSICSFDSQICLAGVKLTAEDRKKMKQRRRDAEDANVEQRSNAVA